MDFEVTYEIDSLNIEDSRDKVTVGLAMVSGAVVEGLAARRAWFSAPIYKGKALKLGDRFKFTFSALPPKGA